MEVMTSPALSTATHRVVEGPPLALSTWSPDRQGQRRSTSLNSYTPTSLCASATYMGTAGLLATSPAASRLVVPQRCGQVDCGEVVP